MGISEAAKQARDLLNSEYQGILCTHSLEVEGYPFGSVVPYCLSAEGQPVILISTIAQHTKNIIVNNKVSLISTESGSDDSQTVGRITYLGDVRKLDENNEETFELYYCFFPQSRDYHKTHDFDFYAIDLLRVRYIGGFGKIYWVEKDKFLKPNPFTFEEQQRMIKHMNDDHSAAIKHYCELNNIIYDKKTEPLMVAIDSEGFHLRTGARIHRINFHEEVRTAIEVREALVTMAKL